MTDPLSLGSEQYRTGTDQSQEAQASRLCAACQKPLNRHPVSIDVGGGLEMQMHPDCHRRLTDALSGTVAKDELKRDIPKPAAKAKQTPQADADTYERVVGRTRARLDRVLGRRRNEDGSITIGG